MRPEGELVRGKPKLFRDPIHDIISLSPKAPETALVLRLLDTAEVQRLRRIRQLGLIHLVYHGAEHSRFAHSMGVLWLALRMLDQLARRGVRVREEDRVVTLVAALLHDIGHGPFSHALEAVTGVPHEERSSSILRDEDTEVGAVLAAAGEDVVEAVCRRLGGEEARVPFLADVTASQLDADRLDYILRDGHGTGIKIGIFDLERIIAMLDVDEGRLAVQSGGREAVEGYLLARFQMYKQVYLHRTGRAAERMLEAALRRAGRLCRAGRLDGAWAEGALGGLIRGEPLTNRAFCSLDDMDIWSAFKAWARGPDPILADLCDGLLRRRIWKVIALTPGGSEAQTEFLAAVRRIAVARGFDPETHLIVDRCQDRLYVPFRRAGDDPSIRIVEPSGRAYALEDRSALLQMLLRLEHRQSLLCCHPALRDEVERCAVRLLPPREGIW